jgi:hypothetical protein
MVLGSIQPLTEMSTRNLPGAKGVRRMRLIASLLSVNRLPRKYGSLDVSTLFVFTACYRYSFTFYIIQIGMYSYSKVLVSFPLLLIVILKSIHRSVWCLEKYGHLANANFLRTSLTLHCQSRNIRMVPNSVPCIGPRHGRLKCGSKQV